MGVHLFVGNTGTGSTRRAVIAFDVAGAIPAGATIIGATLTLHMSRSQAGPQAITLHAILADWGEGTSDAPANEGGGADSTPGDATWVHRFFEADLWSAMGGDFSQTESASASVGGSGSYAWGSTARMVADVQGWLNDPATSFGWLLKGNEQTSQTAKRFDSRQNTNEAFRPVLVIEFGP
ncbi:MAG: DNRLRE domain-containing protein [Chloroflexi bacterium]|nr:DNRLRE domain-containing protein [Chloroflexota bacterium]